MARCAAHDVLDLLRITGEVAGPSTFAPPANRTHDGCGLGVAGQVVGDGVCVREFFAGLAGEIDPQGRADAVAVHCDAPIQLPLIHRNAKSRQHDREGVGRKEGVDFAWLNRSPVASVRGYSLDVASWDHDEPKAIPSLYQDAGTSVIKRVVPRAGPCG
jgi:hypothetical protein